MNAAASNELTHVFVSYAHEDKKWLERDYAYNLIPFLEDSLRRQGVVFWYDKGLIAGEEFKNRIDAEIDQAHIALLIVSQYFLNSEFIEAKEMPRIADRAKLGHIVIVPILVESCDWNEYEFLADRQMVPISRPLIEFTDSDIRWSNVRKEILDGVKAQVKRILAAQQRPRIQDNREIPSHPDQQLAVVIAEKEKVKRRPAKALHVTQGAAASAVATEKQAPLSEKEQIMSILKRYAAGNNFYLWPNVPNFKEAGARETMRIPAEETVLGLIDVTLLGSAKDGLAFTEKGLYFHNYNQLAGVISHQSLREATLDRSIGGAVRFEYQGRKTKLQLLGSDVKDDVLDEILKAIKNLTL